MTRHSGPPVPADVGVGGHPPSPPGNRVLVAALAITQTIGYGALYYCFAVFLTPIAADLTTSVTAVTGAYTASVLASAVLAVPIGRWLDRRGGRALMTGGSLLGTLLLVSLSRVDELWQLYVVQIGIGVASAASLYEAAFAVIIAWHRPRHRSAALLALTVVAGFASTIFLPLAGWLADQHGWRTALLILAAVHAVTVPLHAVVVRRPPGISRDPGRQHGDSGAHALRAALTDRGFWLLAAGFTAHTAAISAYTVLLIAALIGWGHPPAFAAAIAGLLGVLSVTGRLVTTGLQRRYRTTTITAVVFAVQAAAALLLPILGDTTGGAIVAVVAFGFGFGVATIAKPVILAERYDTRRYATLAGVLVVPMTLVKAGSPLGAAVLRTATGSYTPVLVAVAVCCGVAAVALAASSRPALSATGDTSADAPVTGPTD
ncbi:MFS transporter [Actinoplanes derwentensis]|uniref:Predicted arabinose efflux permease, MFS family n=1 Tax=Actinoplanes derwentensis TaxID=113562 RepID=A0A1H1VCL1_9ACTN|nr:MFS transporter [Actinoplanes derwentensis]GID83742.1 MFS transporter [Actinoplanes derwentensis]SDS82423.1 Predicted arabinose efflux permease, MFS family [Actinoplanes derwentensis]